MNEEPRKPEPPAARERRISGLREAVASGRYFVPAEAVARSFLRRIGIEILDPQYR